LNAGFYAYINDYSLGFLPVGNHTIQIITDVTGVITEKTTEFLSRLKRFDNYTLNLSENSWF
jgi:hypothetical protein